jgi:hypothetical protein
VSVDAQMDLIDFSRDSKSSGEYKYILHLKDHFTKATWLRPLKAKSAEEVHAAMIGLVGFIPFQTIQTDNGSEVQHLPLFGSRLMIWLTVL